MHSRTCVDRKVLLIDGATAVHVERGRGDELRHHLAAHNIRARVAPPVGPYDRVVVEQDTEPDVLQAVVDHWER